MKHIEQILPEYAADDMTALLLSDATASAALSRLLHDWTGCAIPPTADTPQSEVEELVPLCLSILRRHWTTPLTALGDGTTQMSLADLLRRLIGDRVQGNEALGIPPANANISTAVAALLDRDMSSGLTLTLTDGTDGSTDGSTTSPTTSPTTTSLPDGLSLAQLLCGSDIAYQATELRDDNRGWVMTKVFNQNNFPNLKRLVLGFKEMSITNGLWYFQPYASSATVSFSDLELPVCKKIGANQPIARNIFGIKRIYAPSIKEYDSRGTDARNCIANTCSDLVELDLSSLSVVHHYSRNSGDAEWAMIGKCPVLRHVTFGHITTWTGSWTGAENFIIDCPQLIHTEFKSVNCSISLKYFTPTMALRTDTDAEDYVDLREDMSFANNLEQFLSNFKTYIAQRLTDKGSGLTLTLSQAVRDAIQQDPDIVNIITSKGWTISPAPSV